MTTSITDVLDVHLPIIQAPMAGVQASALAIAVSNAGGLGSLPCGMLSADAVRAEVNAIRAGTTKPFNVNFFCHRAPTPDPAREAAWRETLQPYYDELGIDSSDVPVAGSRAPFSHEMADALQDIKPPVISFHFGLPQRDLLERVRSWGATILASATTVDEARWLEARGVDVIIAQGFEAGGHRGVFLSDDMTTQMGTFALLPQIVRSVKVPVVAAGGIADAPGVAAAIALGAAGVQVGTGFLLCPETATSVVHRTALTSDAARHTAITNVFTGRPARGIVNRFIRELGPINDRAPQFPLATGAMLPLRAAAEARGSGDFSPLFAGQNTTGCREAPAGEIVRALSERVA